MLHLRDGVPTMRRATSGVKIVGLIVSKTARPTAKLIGSRTAKPTAGKTVRQTAERIVAPTDLVRDLTPLRHCGGEKPSLGSAWGDAYCWV